MNTFIPIVTSFGWAIIHSLWQILLVGLILKITLLLIKKSSPRVKYTLHSFGLFSILIVFGITFYLLWQHEMNPKSAGVVPGVLLFLSDDINSVADILEASINPVPSLSFKSIIQSIDPLISYIAGAWALGFLFFNLRFFGSFIYIQQLKNKYAYPLNNKWQETISTIQRRLQISKPVLLMESALIKIPMVVGHLKPAIILPLGLISQIPYNQLEAIFAHELAHIKRNDYLINFVSTLMESLFFYHPVFWWLTKSLEEQRENCCDDISVAYCGSPSPLQKALFNISTYNEKSLHIAAALYKNDHQLLKRIKRMKTKNLKKPGNSFKPLAFILMLAGLFIILAGSSIAPREGDIPLGLLQPEKPDIIIPHVYEENKEIALPGSESSHQQPQPDTLINSKNNTGSGVINIELDPDGNLINVKKDGENLVGDERKKYEDYIVRMTEIKETEEQLMQKQLTIEKLKSHLEKAELKMEQVQREYQMAQKEYGELRGHVEGAENETVWSIYEDQLKQSQELQELMEKEYAMAEFFNHEALTQQFEDQEKWADMQADLFEQHKEFSDDYFQDIFEHQELAKKHYEENFLKHMDEIESIKEIHEIEMNHLQFENTIRKELQMDNLINKGDNLSFKLSMKRLIVNGKKQNADLHKKYLGIYRLHSDRPLEGDMSVIIED